MLSLQAFDITVSFVAGRDNCLVDGLLGDPINRDSCAEGQPRLDGIIVCRGSRIVIPVALRHQILQISHSSHVGVQKMKEVIRSHAWWPAMSADIASFVRRCDACLTQQRRAQPAPLALIATTRPFEKLSVDLTGPSFVKWLCFKERYIKCNHGMPA